MSMLCHSDAVSTLSLFLSYRSTIRCTTLTYFSSALVPAGNGFVAGRLLVFDPELELEPEEVEAVC